MTHSSKTVPMPPHTMLISAASQIRRVVDELREHGSGRAQWMREQLFKTRLDVVAHADAAHYIFEGIVQLQRPAVAIEHLERAEQSIEKHLRPMAKVECGTCGDPKGHDGFECPADREPDYDAPTARERYEQAFRARPR